ncbi:acyl transferase domain-containing protein [Thermomonospora umbrina]|uniref:Acyl transferase domain-containing protein n=2 Tax=Thermomonospora umbrina TaxID=111806 RepID=A0A3D9SWU1_9ACTN|nr:acyl transferase domain-containing protein [Thermomonospora umbrina]
MDDAVAIVGVGCRYPGARGPQQLWRLLCEGVSTVGTVPEDRPALAMLRASESPGRFGGFLDGVEHFDASFFGVSPREAAKMDPQKRLLLETVWEAFEDAGIPPGSLAGSDTGVFVGEQASDHWDLVRSENCDLHTLVGSHQRAALSGRVSYFFDFRGPSMSVEAACAASSAAVHMAAESVRGGRCRVCVAAGTNLILTPDQTSAYVGAGALAADGRCKFADASADGFTRSEGVGVVVLKRLADARADGDRVYAVILGGAIGHDGRSSGSPMQPAVEGQAHLLRRAYAAAGVDPAGVTYVEAHGTGTRVGDLAELRALGEVVGAGRSRRRPLLVGSLKTNVGHSEAAAGIGGVIKTALCLFEGVIPPSLHLHELNPNVDWQSLSLSVPTEPVSLPRARKPRVAGVSAFGISGTNTHLVLSEAPSQVRPATRKGARAATSESDRHARLLPLSAHSLQALQDLAESYLTFLAPDGGGRAFSPAELCGNAAFRREHLPWRLAVVGADHDEFVSGLRAFVSQEPTDEVAGPREAGERRLAFVFSGHGSQWAGMAREMLTDCPVFARAMTECDRAIAAECGWSVLDLIKGDEPKDHRAVDRAHPALFAVQVALDAVWRSWGVRPDVVVGHSVGEVSAALAAGALSLEDAAKIICLRSATLARLAGTGAMAWVELSRERAEAELAGFEDRLAVAVVNSPSSVVLSGDPAALDSVCGRLEGRGVFSRRIDIDVAAHSPHLGGLAGEMAQDLRSLEPTRCKIPMLSTVLDSMVDGPELDAAYWARNLRDPVLFGPAMRSLLDERGTGHVASSIVEISPHPVVLPAIEAACGEDDLALTCQRRGSPQYASMLAALGRLWTAGHDVDWRAVIGDRPRHVRLPEYPWQHDRFPLPPGTPPAAPAEPSDAAAHHPLLTDWREHHEGDDRVWEGPLDLRVNAHLLDHRVHGTSVMPGAGHIELIAAILGRVHGDRPVTLTDVSFVRPLELDATTCPWLKVALTPGDEASRWRFQISSRLPDGAWAEHVTGRAVPGGSSPERIRPPDAGDDSTAADFYRHWDTRGNQWRGAFRAIATLHRSDGEASGTVRVSAPLPGGRLRVPPPTLDACLQIAVAALPQSGAPDPGHRTGEAVLASGIERIDLHHGLGVRARCRATVNVNGTHDAAADLWIADDDGRVLATLTGMHIHRARSHRPEPGTPASSSPAPTGSGTGRVLDELYDVRWETARPAPSRTPGRMLLLADETGVAAKLDEQPSATGTSHVLAVRGKELRQINDTLWEIDPADADHYARLLALLEADAPCTEIVHLWSLDADTLEEAEQYCCRSTAALTRALSTLEFESPSVTFVTRGAQSVDGGDCPHPEQALMWGLVRVLRNERPALDLRIVDLETAAWAGARLKDVLERSTIEDQLAVRGGRLLAPRLQRHRLRSDRDPGTQAGRRRSSPASTPRPPAPGPGEVTIRTAYAGVNFHDVLVAYGALDDEHDVGPATGAECSGTITAIGHGVHGLHVDDTVVALARHAFAPFVNVPAALVSRSPAGFDPAEAATLPAAYVTAHHALHKMARLKGGESVLIHAATGGVGTAALKVAAWRGARVFATAGNPGKRALLRYLGAEHVNDSRSPHFAERIREAADGRGFDVIVNSTMSGPQWDANFELLAPYGRLIDLTKRDILADHRMGLRPFALGLTYAALDLLRMQQDRPEQTGAELKKVVRLAERGIFPPLPYETFAPDQVDEAFALMARGDHLGKLLIDHTGTDGRHVAATAPVSAQQEPVVRPDAAYLVTGGLGGLGIEAAGWLIRSGARHILLTGRSALPDSADCSDGARLRVLRDMQSRAHVTYVQIDAADPHAMRQALQAWREDGGPPIRGVLHCAGVLEAREIADLTPEHNTTVLGPKAHGARALTQVLHRIDLDFLVFFSAGSALLGLPFIGVYAAANAYLDALAHRLRADGVPATSVNWGYWNTVGMAARRQAELGHSLVPDGMTSFTPQEGITALSRLVRERAAQVAVLPTDWSRWSRAFPRAAGASLFLHLAPPAEPPPAPRPSETPSPEEHGHHADSADARTSASLEPSEVPPPDSTPRNIGDLLELIREQAGLILGTPAERVRPDQPLNTQGLDSLLAMELRNRIERRLSLTVPTAQLFDLTPQSLASHLARR